MSGQHVRTCAGVSEVEIGGGPDPVVEVVAIADFAESLVHLASGHLHDGAVAGVFEGDVLDTVCAKNREFANELVKLRNVPPVPRVRACPVA